MDCTLLGVKRKLLHVIRPTRMSTVMPHFHHFKEFLLVCTPTLLIYMGVILRILRYWHKTRKHTGKDLTSILSVAKLFFRDHPSVDIRPSIQERNDVNVMSVGKSLGGICRSPVVREFTLERDLTNITSVTKRLVVKQPFEDIREFILERNFTNVMSVAKTFHQSSHFRKHQLIHPG